ncbi:LOW QUALITY PROTEIN: hypothetical protein M8C21_022951, partial [Ambrosia artemisiifolia]
ENSSSGPPSTEVVADKKKEKNRDPDVKSGRAEKDSTAKTDGGNDGGQEAQNRVVRKREKDGNVRQKGERRRSKPNPRLSNPTKNLHGEQVAAGWPAWLSAVAGEAINGWIPRRADTFEKIDKATSYCYTPQKSMHTNDAIMLYMNDIGQGTYSNVYKAKDTMTGKIVALKKVRFDNLEPESVKFMAREILILRRLDHPNVVKLEGLVKCYMHQLLSGLEHCHNRHVLHRDIKGSNLLLDNDGSLKIADFGLASFFDPNHKQPMTSRVVTLWYRPPELLLGATDYGVGIDLWSAGCILAELLAGKPIMPGRTEFFMTKPYACDPSSLPKYPPTKEMDAKLRDEEARRLRAAGKSNADGVKKTRTRERPARAMPAPEANAELQVNID